MCEENERQNLCSLKRVIKMHMKYSNIYFGTYPSPLTAHHLGFQNLFILSYLFHLTLSFSQKSYFMVFYSTTIKVEPCPHTKRQLALVHNIANLTLYAYIFLYKLRCRGHFIWVLLCW